MAWVLSDGSNSVNIDLLTEWDKGKSPRKRKISAQGRNWDRVHHDGAGPLTITITGVLVDTTPSALETRVNRLRTWMEAGTILSLTATSPSEPGFTQSNLTLEVVEAPRRIAQLTHRWASLVLVKTEE